MVMSLLVIGIVLLCAWIWMSRGFFSGLLNLACVLVAGAVAFAFWEPIAYAVLKSAPDRGVLSFLGGTAWAIGLAAPFAVTLALLRVATDALLPANAQVETAVDYGGGIVTGACAGLIIAGFTALTISFLRLPPDQFGYKPIDYGNQGSIAHKDKLWLPADRLTAKLYGHFSRNALRTSTPLGEYYPDLADVGGAMRTSFSEGKARNTYKPSDFDFEGRYTLGEPGKAKLNDLLNDQWDSSVQRVEDVDGQPISGGHVEGYTITFKSGAKEKGGQVVIGNAQIRLVCISETDEEDLKTVYPHAVICQAEAANPAAARFRFDSNNVFIASVGGASESKMAFEFVVPTGYKARFLYVKNVREEVPAEPQFKFANVAARDAAINDGRIIKGIMGASTRTTTSSASSTALDPSEPEGGLRITRSLPNGYVIQLGEERGLQVNENRSIYDGEAAFEPERVKRGSKVDQALRIDKFTTREDTVVVQVDIVAGQRTSLLGRSLDTALTVVPPVLVDSNGQQYEPVGYIYEDNQMVKIRFTPQQPVRGLAQLPAPLSKSRPDQHVKLVYMVSFGVTIEQFRIGNEVITDWRQAPLKPIKLDQKQR